MQKVTPLMVLIVIIPILFVGALVVRFLSGAEDGWVCDQGRWVKHGHPLVPQPKFPCDQPTSYTDIAPEQIVDSFFTWYLAQAGQALTNKTYQERIELADSFKQKVDQIMAANQDEGYDPLVLAQDMPAGIQIGTPVIQGEIARVQVTETFGSTVKTIEVALAKQGIWQITDIQAVETPVATTPGTTRMAVVYYNNPQRAAGSIDCGLVFGVERQVSTEGGYAAVLNELFQGPSPEEKQQGYTSFFSDETTGILRDVWVKDGTAYVDLVDIRTRIPNASSSCGSQELLAQIGETLKHDGTINQVVYAIDGDPQAFYEWLQLSCPPESNQCDPAPFNQPSL